MTEFVRVKDLKTKHEYSAPKRWAEAQDPKELEILKDKEHTDPNGRPLPAKPHVELPAAGKSAGTSRQTGGESQ